MILKRTTRNNGYGCSCCSQTWDDAEWLDELLLPSFEEVLEKAINVIPYGKYGDDIYCVYERNGKTIYGYELDVNRNDYKTFIWIGEEKIQWDEAGEVGKTKQEILSLFIKNTP